MNDASAPCLLAVQPASLRVLLLEDLPADAELLLRELDRAGLRVAHERVATEDAFRAALRDFRPDLVLADFFLPHFDAENKPLFGPARSSGMDAWRRRVGSTDST